MRGAWILYNSGIDQSDSFLKAVWPDPCNYLPSGSGSEIVISHQLLRSMGLYNMCGSKTDRKTLYYHEYAIMVMVVYKFQWSETNSLRLTKTHVCEGPIFPFVFIF